MVAQAQFVSDEVAKFITQQKQVKHPQVEDFTAVADFEKVFQNVVQKGTDGKILDILDKTMKNMRGNLTLKTLTELAMKKTLDSIKTQLQQNVTQNQQELKKVIENLRKVGSKESLLYADQLEKLFREEQDFQQKSGQLKDCESAAQMLEQYKGRNVGHQMEQILAAYQDDAKLAKVQEERAKSAKKAADAQNKYELQMQQLLAALQEAKTPEEKARIQKQIDDLMLMRQRELDQKAAQDKLNALADLKANCDPKEYAKLEQECSNLLAELLVPYNKCVKNQMQVKPTEYQFERMPYSVMIETALEKKPELAVKGLSKVDKSQLPSAIKQMVAQAQFVSDEVAKVYYPAETSETPSSRRLHCSRRF
ncbi:Hypothetical_protein [Hexamita inflata]|uniref:Hypothetical_protein n=1 Tax=Hexamita inflata TaxID=28002 RepID=A0AA86V3Q2_9EUKA|nr:Hypothetical protein HINF_LOCUS43608 [Hexamita inflata]